VVKLSRAARPSTSLVTAINERGDCLDTAIAGEHPLTIFLDKRELLTLMTLGAAPEELVLGYLRNQGLVFNLDDISAVQVDWEVDAVAVTTQLCAQTGQTIWDHPEHTLPLQKKLAHKTVTTGCGQGTVFGNMMEQIDGLTLQAPVLAQEVIYQVMDNVRRHESIYKVAGAVHGCALADANGNILRFVEDVGRHNAVDAIAGWMWLNRLEGNNLLFYTTGRLTSEMVIKCAQMGISVLLSRSGLTKMGYDIAVQLGMLMIGRCQGRHYLAFTRPELVRRMSPARPE
jgi:FdhD protein